MNLSDFRFDTPIYVTRPTMPPIDKFMSGINDIWERKSLSNFGILHEMLEDEIEKFLDINHCMLFNNGTTALDVGVMALQLSGEVITTPFTFPATPNVLIRNNIIPVFCDIRNDTLNIDPYKIRKLISSRTTALMPVHVYGNPCDVDVIESIAKEYGLKVIYDAAQCFGVKINNRSVLSYGDITMVSFHATKVFSTIEGGMLTINGRENEPVIEVANAIRNFGYDDSGSILYPGINGKMNEIQALYGLISLELVVHEIDNRKQLYNLYREKLSSIGGISFLNIQDNVDYNYAYMPIRVDSSFSVSRDELFEMLTRINVFPRKYFYPLCSHYPFYKNHPSANPNNLPVAEISVKEILCLPLYGTLKPSEVLQICAAIDTIAKQS